MPEPYWKRREREIRKELGMERDVHLGEEGADGVNEWCVEETKCRAHLPAWIRDALYQAQHRASPAQLPIAILHGKGDRGEQDLVVMTLKDFREWFNGGDEEPEP